MRRREFIAASRRPGGGLGPSMARAQRPAMPVIGFINGQSADDYAPFVPQRSDGVCGRRVTLRDKTPSSTIAGPTIRGHPSAGAR